MLKRTLKTVGGPWYKSCFIKVASVKEHVILAHVVALNVSLKFSTGAKAIVSLLITLCGSGGGPPLFRVVVGGSTSGSFRSTVCLQFDN